MSNQQGDWAQSKIRRMVWFALGIVAFATVTGVGQEPIDRTPEYIKAAYEEAKKNPCTIIAPLNPEQGLPETNPWPCNAVYYTFDANTTLANQQAALNAMAEIEAVTSVQFLARTTEPNFVNFKDDSGNSSLVGMVGGAQDINISSWGFRFIIVHEILHALGIYHEQQRSDRNIFVTIVPANIQAGFENNFSITPGATPFGAYDFDSLMHYGECFFSVGCPMASSCNCPMGTETILVEPPNDIVWQNLIGQRDHLSTGDIDTLDFLYPPDTDCNRNGLADSCDIAAEAITYARDDGSQEGGIGVTGGGDIIWLNHNTVTAGGESVDTLHISWGNVALGTLTTLVLWDDPNNDGDPSDAFVIFEMDGVPVTDPFEIEDRIVSVPIPLTGVGSAGDSFFVGALITHGNGENPAGYDDGVSQVASWFALNGPGLGNINNLPANGFFSQADAAGAPYNFMVRATKDTSDSNGNLVYDDCDFARGDNTLDNIVGIEDFLAILAKWGPCAPAPCAEDSDFDGDVGIVDFLNVLANWD